MPSISEEIKSSFENERQKAIVNILFTGSWLKNKHAELIKPYDISTQQYNILRILRGAKNEQLTMQTVKSRMLEKSPNTTRLTDRLLSKKLIERKRSENDRRVVYVKITQKGLDLLAELDENEMKDFQVMQKNLSEEEGTQLSNLLDKLRGNE